MPGRRSVRPRRWSLRGRLLAVLVTLIVGVSVIIGAVTVVALRGFLVGRLDAQLSSAGFRSANAVARPPPGGGGGGGAQFVVAPGQAAGTLGARISGGVVTAAGVLNEGGSLQDLTTGDAGALAAVPVDGHPHTRTIGRRGQFRLLATRIPTGDVLITGLPLADLDRTVYRLIAVEVGVAVIALLAATGAGALILARTLRPLHRVAATATRVSTLPLERGEVALAERIDAVDVDDRTEVGQVAGAVNRLLDHVTNALTARQASETRVRQFVADASHELRTPLAAIRGYAELTRLRREPAPPDIAHAMARVESESARMTTLVDDLLLLARLDTGRALAREPVDLTHLILDAVSDASAAGRDHRWRLDLPDDAVFVDGDAAALHQVVTNLLANARVHTPPGTTVTAALASSSPGTVVLSVLDDGPGIDPALVASVFERFVHRAGTTGSSGLGLAIVSAIVHAHSGTVHVTSRPGQTVFLVRLPTNAQPPGALPPGALPAAV